MCLPLSLPVLVIIFLLFLVDEVFFFSLFFTLKDNNIYLWFATECLRLIFFFFNWKKWIFFYSASISTTMKLSILKARESHGELWMMATCKEMIRLSLSLFSWQDPFAVFWLMPGNWSQSTRQPANFYFLPLLNVSIIASHSSQRNVTMCLSF